MIPELFLLTQRLWQVLQTKRQEFASNFSLIERKESHQRAQEHWHKKQSIAKHKNLKLKIRNWILIYYNNIDDYWLLGVRKCLWKIFKKKVCQQTNRNQFMFPFECMNKKRFFQSCCWPSKNSIVNKYVKFLKKGEENR